MTIEGLRRILTPEGQELLASLPPYDPDQALSLNQTLRQHHDPELVAAALTQSALRARATAKLGQFAATMLFTEAGLQQATRLEVAALHARRYRDAGVERVFDLGCGLGVDALAFAGLGLPVTAVDNDEATAALALFNLRAFPDVTVLLDDALHAAQSATPRDGIYADPARRTSTARVFDPAAYSPPLESLFALRSRVPALGVKVAPGISYDHLPSDVHAQWISVHGEVVEAGCWFGALAAGAGRSAVVKGARGVAELHVTDDPRAPAASAPVGKLGKYVIEPDGAVIRSGGVAVLAEQLGANAVSEQIAYLTADEAYVGPLAETFEVVETFPYSKEKLAAWCRSRGIGILEIKKRGVDVVPDRLRAGLKLRGEGSATVILTRVGGRHLAIVATRVGASTS